MFRLDGSYSGYEEEEEEKQVPDPVLFFPGGDADCGAAATGRTGLKGMSNQVLSHR